MHLAAASHLESLNLSGCRHITAPAAPALVKCSALADLELNSTELTKEEASRLQEQLGWCQVNIEGGVIP